MYRFNYGDKVTLDPFALNFAETEGLQQDTVYTVDEFCHKLGELGHLNKIFLMEFPGQAYDERYFTPAE